jgi:hypothetical protein
LHFVLQHGGNTRLTKKKSAATALFSSAPSSKKPKNPLSRLVDFFNKQLPGYVLLSAENKLGSAKLRTSSRSAVFFSSTGHLKPR